MQTFVNLTEKTVIFVDPTLQEIAEFLDETKEGLGDFKTILEWSSANLENQ